MNNSKKKKVCITGGHLSPAIAVIEEIREQKRDWELVFVGRNHTSTEIHTVSEERKRITALDIPFIPIHAGKFSRFLSVASLLDFLRIPVGFVESCGICLHERPDCIVSFGGYIGLPMVIAGWLFGIPTVIHEQTQVMGLANTIASEFADKILLTFARNKREEDARIQVVGLPVRNSFIHPKNRLSFPIPKGKPILYITGGTTGSVHVNRLMMSIIPFFLSSHIVIHQTGEYSYPDAVQFQKNLPTDLSTSYIPKPYIGSDDVSWIMHHMEVMIGRSGANTVMETAIVQKPAVFIPLPWSGKHEQLRNALWYASLNADVRILNEAQVTPDEIKQNIIEVLKQKQATAARSTTLFTTGAPAVVDVIASLT